MFCWGGKRKATIAGRLILKSFIPIFFQGVFDTNFQIIHINLIVFNHLIYIFLKLLIIDSFPGFICYKLLNVICQ